MKLVLLTAGLMGSLFVANAEAATSRQTLKQEQYERSQEVKFCELVQNLSYDAMDARQKGHFYQEFLGSAKRHSESFVHFSNESALDRKFPLFVDRTTLYLVKEQIGLKTYEARIQSPSKWADLSYNACLTQVAW